MTRDFSQDDDGRLDAREVSENFDARGDEKNLDEREEKEEEARDDVYERTSFIWDEEEQEVRGYAEDEEEYGERGIPEDEEEEEETAVTSFATISAAEKSEEEAQDAAAEADHVLAEIPAEVRINLSFTIILPVELLCLTTFVIS